jgi:hypothetical protein
LLAPLMQLLQCLFSGVFFFHHLLSRKSLKSSYFIVPYL